MLLPGEGGERTRGSVVLGEGQAEEQVEIAPGVVALPGSPDRPRRGQEGPAPRWAVRPVAGGARVERISVGRLAVATVTAVVVGLVVWSLGRAAGPLAAPVWADPGSIASGGAVTTERGLAADDRGDPPEPTPGAPETAAAAQTAGTADPGEAAVTAGAPRPGNGTDWWAVLGSLDMLRQAALEAVDETLVSGYAEPDSAAWHEDAALIGDLRDRGLRPTGLSTRLVSVQLEESGPDQASLRVVDDRSAYELRDPSGAVISTRPATGQRAWRVLLGRSDEGYRVREVMPMAEPTDAGP